MNKSGDEVESRPLKRIMGAFKLFTIGATAALVFALVFGVEKVVLNSLITVNTGKELIRDVIDPADPARGRPSPDMRALTTSLQVLLTLDDFDKSGASVQGRREKMDNVYKLFPSIPPTHLQEAKGCPVKAHWVLPPSGTKSSKVVVYLHGGGFVVGSGLGHLSLVHNRMDRLGMRFLAVEYPLVPENKMTKVVSETVKVFKYLIEKENISPENIVLAGDSAGGNLVGLVTLKLMSEKAKLPCALWMISPWIDLTSQGEGDNDPIFTRANLDYYVEALATACDGKPKSFSPIKHDLKGFPPTLLHSGSLDIIAGDIRKFADKLAKAGVNMESFEVDGAFHCYPLFDTPESSAAFDAAAEFINGQCGSA